MTLFFFDIDGTLLRTGGAGRAAFDAAARRLFGARDAFARVDFAGAVDASIADQALRLNALPVTPRRVARLRETYFRMLRRSIRARAADGRAALCPGAAAAVAAVGQVAPLGLLTGNWRTGARVKLAALDLWAPFVPALGAFGEDGHLRQELFPVAVRRARRRGLTAERVVIIGDTPADVRCARLGAAAMGARAPELITVAVCTGLASREALEATAPEWLFADLDAALPTLLSLA